MKSRADEPKMAAHNVKAPRYSGVRAWLRYFRDLPTREEWEWLRVLEAVRRTRGNQTQACKLLDMSRGGLQRKLKRGGLV